MASPIAPRKFRAFVSYSSKDERWGRWLHRKLENYVVPKPFRSLLGPDGAPIGERLRPVFRDRDELPGSAQLSSAIAVALENSSFLVVLCSPRSARSQWVNREIEAFRAMGGGSRIQALILDGIPNASGSDAARECFPAALRHPFEPIAADLRKEGDGRTRSILKLVAGLTGLDFDALYRRHERSTRLRWTVGALIAFAVMVSLSALSVTAWTQSREARVLLSQRLLTDGLASLQKGNVEEGLRILVSSLRASPENSYARDRLLFELAHRSWVFHIQSLDLPKPLIAERAETTPHYSPKAWMMLNPQTDGSIQLDEHLLEEAAGGQLKRRSVWRNGVGWIVGEIQSAEPTAKEIDSIDLGKGRYLKTQAVEGKRGSQGLYVESAHGESFFNESGTQSDVPERLYPSGIAALSPDGKTLAVAGLEPPSTDDSKSFNLWQGELHVHLSIFDTQSLSLKHNFSFPIAEDADVTRIWWSNGKVAVHTEIANREMARLDWIDFTADRPRFLIKNKGVPHGAWFFLDGRIYSIHDLASADRSQPMRLAIEEIRIPDFVHKGVKELTKADLVLLLESPERDDTFNPAQKMSWSGDPNTRFAGHYWEEETDGTIRRAMWKTGRTSRYARLDSNRVTITNGDHTSESVTRLRVGFGEGGRRIRSIHFSPDGRYLLVKGDEVGGGTGDFELIDTELGLQVFPVVGRGDHPGLVPLFESVLLFGSTELKVIGWTRDSRFLVAIPPRKNFSEKYRTMTRRDLFSEEVLLIPIRLCDGPVPTWILDVADDLLVATSVGTGVQKISPNLKTLRELAVANLGEEYGKWLLQVLGAD